MARAHLVSATILALSCGGNAAVAQTTIETDGNVEAQGFIGDGSQVTEVDAQLLDGMDSSEFTPVGHIHTVADITGAPKTFYLTDAGVFGNQALTACASDYHMATLWEFRDLSGLWYDPEVPGAEGNSRDLGVGGQPVVTNAGWVRTGAISRSDGSAGEANCDLWTNGAGGTGTRAHFVPGFPPALSLDTSSCGALSRVWCMKN